MNKDRLQDNGELIIYCSEEGDTKIDVRFVDETVWLSQAQLAELFQSSKSNISEHIKHILEEGEQEEKSVVRKFRTTSSDGKTDSILYYNLDMIISLGYRIKSKTATNFRKWATERLKEYMIKGFAMDDSRLKNLGGGTYWKELLERIRDIRTSEKVMYRQVLDLYATSIDYDPKSNESIEFFKMIQNKLHYAVHGQTAAELIYTRADSDKEFMGLTSFEGKFPTKRDIGIAKNYLTTSELERLKRLVSGYFEFAEMQAIEHKPMQMKDYLNTLDSILKSTGKSVLTDLGRISHSQASKKAECEYKKYQNENLSPVEKEYLAEIKNVEKIAKKGSCKESCVKVKTDK